MKVWIDQDLCTGDGLCEEIAPDVFVGLDDGLFYVKEGDKISKPEADEMLVHEIEEYENYVNTAVNVPLSQNQFDAIVSWVFNLGNGNLRASTMLKVINSGDHAGVPAQIKRWNKAGGKVLDGLVRRREAEALLYEGKEWSHV